MFLWDGAVTRKEQNVPNAEGIVGKMEKEKHGVGDEGWKNLMN